MRMAIQCSVPHAEGGALHAICLTWKHLRPASVTSRGPVVVVGFKEQEEASCDGIVKNDGGGSNGGEESSELFLIYLIYFN